MSSKNKWAQVMGLALAYPSTILFSAWMLKELVDSGAISKLLGVLLFLAILGNTLVLMVIYAYKNKNKS